MREVLKLRRLALIAPVLFVAGFYTACSDDHLKTIATNVDRVAVLISDGREVRDELEEQGIISRDEARKITVGLIKVNTALKAFNTRARTYAQAGELPASGKVELKKLAEDIVGAVQELISNGTFGVKDPNAQIRINSTIGALKQVTLTIVDTVSLIKTKGAK